MKKIKLVISLLLVIIFGALFFYNQIELKKDQELNYIHLTVDGTSQISKKSKLFKSVIMAHAILENKDFTYNGSFFHLKGNEKEYSLSDTKEFEDYLLYFSNSKYNQYLNANSIEESIKSLAILYYEDENYISKLQEIIKKYNLTIYDRK